MADKYELVEKIGEGNFGEVWKAKIKSSGEIVACKLMPLSDASISMPAVQRVNNINIKSNNIYFNRIIYFKNIYI